MTTKVTYPLLSPEVKDMLNKVNNITSPQGDEPLGGFDSYDRLQEYEGSATVVTVGVLGTNRAGIYGKFVLIPGATAATHPPDGGTWVEDGSGRIFARLGHKHSNAYLDWWAVGDGDTPDADAVIAALNYGIKHGKPIYASASNYLIEKEINLDTLSTAGQMVGLIGVEGVYYRTDTSGIKPTVFTGAAGLTRMFYQPFGGVMQRRCLFKNIAIRSKDAFDDLTLRASLRAFDIFNSPYSHYENIEAIGITSLLHLRTCWMSKLINISTNRCIEGVFVDGDDGTGGYGFADHVSIENIACGGYANNFGLRIRGTRTFTINGLDLESGYTGTGVILEGCSQGAINSVYVEGFANGVPIYIKPIDGSELDDIAEFSTDIEIKGVHGLSNVAGIVLIRPGVMNIKFNGVSENRGDAAGRESANGEWLRVTGATNTPNSLIALQNISIEGFNTSDKPIPDSLFKSTFYSQIFNLNGNITRRQSDNGYYGLTLQSGSTLVNTVSSTKQIVVSSGTLAASPLTSTATTTANSRKIVLTNTTGLFVGTYITVGGQDGLFVTKIERATNTVWLGTAITSSGSDVSVSYTAPVLI